MSRYGAAEVGPGHCRFLWIVDECPPAMAEMNRRLCEAKSSVRWMKVSYPHLRDAEAVANL